MLKYIAVALVACVMLPNPAEAQRIQPITIEDCTYQFFEGNIRFERLRNIGSVRGGFQRRREPIIIQSPYILASRSGLVRGSFRAVSEFRQPFCRLGSNTYRLFEGRAFPPLVAFYVGGDDDRSQSQEAVSYFFGDQGVDGGCIAEYEAGSGICERFEVVDNNFFIDSTGAVGTRGQLIRLWIFDNRNARRR